ncbi:hypothetical protein D3C73_1655620 [compost metagenome]
MDAHFTDVINIEIDLVCSPCWAVLLNVLPHLFWLAFEHSPGYACGLQDAVYLSHGKSALLVGMAVLASAEGL